jgi:purine-nucleoside phosphorylase
MPTYKLHVEQAVDHIRSRLHEIPRIGILTGTGLSESTSRLKTSVTLDYSAIPHFPQSTVESHAGKLCLGRFSEKPVMVFKGRFHLYEGYSPKEVAFPIRVMQALGVRVLILSNAAGGLNPSFSPGDVMVIDDHLNLTGKNPLIGPNEDAWGLRFPDMSAVYDTTLASAALKAGSAGGISVKTGIYAGLAGPSLETPAEVRFLRTIGADAVGFSTVTEAIAAVHAGMRVLGLSTITNVHNPDRPEQTSISEIIQLAEKIAPKVEIILEEVIKHIHV